MAFEKPTIQNPTTIARMEIRLVDQVAVGELPATQKSSYRMIVLDQDDRPIEFQKAAGNLAPHLTAEEISNLQAFMATLRTRAEAAILG